MTRVLLGVLLLLAARIGHGEEAASHELFGRIGTRPAYMALYAVKREDGGWRLSGEYVQLDTLQRRFLEGERSPELGVTFLKEGTTSILFGRPPTATLQGTFRDGVLKGARYAPGGQLRESFEFSQRFGTLERFDANVNCHASDSGYRSTLAFRAAGGAIGPGSFQWTSEVAPSGHACSLAADNLRQEPFAGGLRLVAAGTGEGARASRCSVTLRDLGEVVLVAAEQCQTYCGSQSYFEPLLVDKRGGGCRLLHPRPR